jgi:hypothetical protein
MNATTENILEQLREDVIGNNNTAQVSFTNLLRTQKTHIEELHIPFELHGDLDLSIIKTEKFTNLNKLFFRDGELTSLKNIPENIKLIECPHNLIKELGDLPGSLTHLDIRENYIKTLDLKKASSLSVLHCEHNALENIHNIPPTLEELYIDNNNMNILDLDGLNKLRILHASNNHVLIVKNKPNSLIDYKNDNNTLSSMDTTIGDKEREPKEIINKVTYNQACNDFFRIKKKYEEELFKMRKKKYKTGKTIKGSQKRSRSVVPLCLNCKKKGGMIFDITRDRYAAYCGNKEEPCKFVIELTRGSYVLTELYLNTMQEILDDSKETIIRQKMDTLFDFISEETSARVFKEKITEFERDATLYNDELKKYNELYNNAGKENDIKKKQITIYNINQKIRTLIDEYKENGNTSILKLIVNLYKTELIPETENLQKIKYDVVEMDTTNEDENRLIQYEVHPSREEVNDSEEPSVIKFVSNL